VPAAAGPSLAARSARRSSRTSISVVVAGVDTCSRGKCAPVSLTTFSIWLTGTRQEFGSLSMNRLISRDTPRGPHGHGNG
jgi:hypothetical protein